MMASLLEISIKPDEGSWLMDYLVQVKTPSHLPHLWRASCEPCFLGLYFQPTCLVSMENCVDMVSSGVAGSLQPLLTRLGCADVTSCFRKLTACLTQLIDVFNTLAAVNWKYTQDRGREESRKVVLGIASAFLRD
jgi:hypothetical protein